MSKQKYDFSEEDYSFMQNLNAAILEQSPKKVSRVINVLFFTLIVFIAWASLTEIDEVTRGSGDVVPSGENQVVQNLEGGITEAILVHEGDIVEKGQILIKIKNVQSTTSFESNEIKLKELKARSLRLRAEVRGKKFVVPKTKDPVLKEFAQSEYALYVSEKQSLQAQINALNQQVAQKNSDLRETRRRVKNIRKSLAFVNDEVKITRPMVAEGIRSKVDFLKLQREAADMQQKLDSAIDSIPSIKAQVNEVKHKIRQARLDYKNKAKLELNAISSEIKQISSSSVALGDQVSRTDVKSPVSGIVKKLFVHTVGGVISPGSDIVEVVPSEDKLLLEVKIKPSDIAFLHPKAKATVKFSAYDFAIHGGLEGEIVRISPDTITDEKDNKFYLIYIQTKKTHLGSDEHPLTIIPGMMVDVDIITGKKTLMQYILKPILKSKQYIFSER